MFDDLLLYRYTKKLYMPGPSCSPAKVLCVAFRPLNACDKMNFKYRSRKVQMEVVYDDDDDDDDDDVAS